MVSKSHFPIDFPTLSHCKSNIYLLDPKFIRKKIGCLWGSAMGKILDALKIRFLILANFSWEILKQCTFSLWSRWLMAITSTIHGLGIATPNPLGAASSTHHGWCSMRLVRSKSVGGKNSYHHYNHCVNGGFLYAWVISKLLGLWCGDDPVECTIVIHIPWVTLDALGLVKICWGDE